MIGESSDESDTDAVYSSDTIEGGVSNEGGDDGNTSDGVILQNGLTFK